MPRVSVLSAEPPAGVVECVESATSDSLTVPDWGVNIQLCDIINEDPGQAGHAVKLLKGRLENKSLNVQLLALTVLDCLSKNCGESVLKQIVAQKILKEMVKIVKKKPDKDVTGKILDMMHTWQGAGEEYRAAYQELRTAGFEFPPRVQFTATQSHDAYASAFVETPTESASSAMSLQKINNGLETAKLLSQILEALDCKDQKDIEQNEVVVQLVQECRSYKMEAIVLGDNNRYKDNAIHTRRQDPSVKIEDVLQQYDEIIAGNCSPLSLSPPTGSPPPHLRNIHHERG